MSLQITISSYPVVVGITATPVTVTLGATGLQGPAVPLVQTISVVSPSATSAPSEAAAAAALAENKIWTDEITGARMKPYLTAGKLRWRAVTTLLLCLCSLGARADQEAVSVDSATRQTAQDVDFAGRITVPTPTSASQVATKGSSETAAATAAASAQAAAIAASDPAGTAAAALEVHNTATSGAHTSLLAGKLNTFTGSSGNLLVAAGFEGGLSVSSINQNSLVLTSTLTNTLLGYSSTSHSHTYGSLSGTPISWDWGALVNIPTSFAPTAHALTHSSTGGDAITPASIGAQPAGDYVITPTFTGHTSLTGTSPHGLETTLSSYTETSTYFTTFSDSSVGVPIPIVPVAATFTYLTNGLFFVTAATSTNMIGMHLYAANTPTGYGGTPYYYSAITAAMPAQWVLWRTAYYTWRICAVSDGAGDYFEAGNMVGRAAYAGAGTYAGTTITLGAITSVSGLALTQNGNGLHLWGNQITIPVGVFPKPVWANTIRITAAHYYGTGEIGVIALAQTGLSTRREWVAYVPKTGTAFTNYTVDISGFPANTPMMWMFFSTRLNLNTNDDFSLTGAFFVK